MVLREDAAFAELYALYHRRLARFLRRFTTRHDVIEEIINDTMWVVWRKCGEFRGDSLVSTWIMGIAYRRAMKTLQYLAATQPVGPALWQLAGSQRRKPAGQRRDPGLAEGRTCQAAAGAAHGCWNSRIFWAIPARKWL